MHSGAALDLDPDDVHAVELLMADLASYVTGHTLLVDGGWMAAYTIGFPAVPSAGFLDAT
ncbi:MAG: hypothetical protein J4G00_02835 [Actinomycetia bacterium]|nr:hypothetical protein [Actinomycetes bacterium]